MVAETKTTYMSFEELVTSQCQDLEKSMLSEIREFYAAFQAKLQEIQKRRMHDNGYGEAKEKEAFGEGSQEMKMFSS